MANTKTPNPIGRDEELTPGRPKYRQVDQPIDDPTLQVSGEKQENSEDFDEGWMDEKGDEVTPEERVFAEDSNETSGGRRPGKRKGTRGGDSPAT